MNLTIKDLSFQYFVKKPILTNFSYTFESQSITAIIGPSGIGKTTLFQLILGFLKPHQGTISRGDTLLSSPQFVLPTEKRGIGAVFQDFALFPHLTVKENIAFGLKGSPASIHEQVLMIAHVFELSDVLNAYPYRLSGGQMQRVAFARSLAPCPQTLLLDEPFSNLDETLTESLRKTLRMFLKNKGITALIVTHDEKDVARFADTSFHLK
jgi:iron(III) transport system ATP-binding protein